VSDHTGLTCLPNIGPRQRRRRLVLAGVWATIALAVALFAVLPHLDRVWRLAVFPPTWIAVLCYLEARHHTCVVLAARGLRNLDAGNERVDDATERRASAAQSTAIYVRSTIVAAIVVIGLFLVP
jgi:hypothetical protein